MGGIEVGWVPFLGLCKFCALSCFSKLGVSGLDSGRLWICLRDIILPEIFCKLYWPGDVGQLCDAGHCAHSKGLVLMLVSVWVLSLEYD